MAKKTLMSEEKKMNQKDSLYEGKDNYFMDEDRMVNEGLAGGYVTNKESGYIEESTVDTMKKYDS